MARAFVTELPTQDAWAVIKDVLDGKIDDLDLALRTVNDVLSFASYMYVSKVGPTTATPVYNSSAAKEAVKGLAAGDPVAVNWRDILMLILDWLRSFLSK